MYTHREREAMMPFNTTHRNNHFHTYTRLLVIDSCRLNAFACYCFDHKTGTSATTVSFELVRAARFYTSFNTHTYGSIGKQIKMKKKKHENVAKPTYVRTQKLWTDKQQQRRAIEQPKFFCHRQNNNNCVRVCFGWLVVLFSYREPIQD